MTSLDQNGPYHSECNALKAKELCGCGVYPMKGKVKGPAPNSEEGCLDGQCDDLLDEVLYYFKANMLFQQYSVQGAGDRALLYLTLYVHYVVKLSKGKTQEDMKRVFIEERTKEFSHPGDKSFPLAGFLPAPKNAAEAEEWKAYMKQCREELFNRLIPMLYKHPNADGHPDKFWMMFCKKKFLGKTL
eukprot:TRINITY_DN2325_c0_g4_i1.p2 TRINITY_DN2325_c0_g4~~TRINITY_DN2325_c0_g4_i1.p2  ORF type:complete len:187 (+),score=96.79 TRINITY_DN2325_c0_g4_i1:49-609(+)